MLCKCSGKYIDIYFILKITWLSLSNHLTPLFLWSSSSACRSLSTTLFCVILFDCELQCPQRPVCLPSWDLVKVLTYFRGPVFESLHTKSLRIVMMVTFLLPWLLLSMWANCKCFRFTWRIWARISPSPIFQSLWRRWSWRGILYLTPFWCDPSLSSLGISQRSTSALFVSPHLS